MSAAARRRWRNAAPGRRAAPLPRRRLIAAGVLVITILSGCSGRNCAYYGAPDANTPCVVISAPTIGGGA
jgi:hypothetical protein